LAARRLSFFAAGGDEEGGSAALPAQFSVRIPSQARLGCERQRNRLFLALRRQQAAGAA